MAARRRWPEVSRCKAGQDSRGSGDCVGDGQSRRSEGAAVVVGVGTRSPPPQPKSMSIGNKLAASKLHLAAGFLTWFCRSLIFCSRAARRALDKAPREMRFKCIESWAEFPEGDIE